MTIRFDLPPSIEQRVRAAGADPDLEAKAAYLADLHRRDLISFDDLADALGLGFHQAQQLLKDHGVGDDFTLAEFESERALLRGLDGP